MTLYIFWTCCRGWFCVDNFSTNLPSSSTASYYFTPHRDFHPPTYSLRCDIRLRWRFYWILTCQDDQLWCLAILLCTAPTDKEKVMWIWTVAEVMRMWSKSPIHFSPAQYFTQNVEYVLSTEYFHSYFKTAKISLQFPLWDIGSCTKFRFRFCSTPTLGPALLLCSINGIILWFR